MKSNNPSLVVTVIEDLHCNWGSWVANDFEIAGILEGFVSLTDKLGGGLPLAGKMEGGGG